MIELMIVGGILSILASISIPKYYYYQLRSKRSEAYLIIGAVKLSEEAFLASYDNYAAVPPNPAVLPGIASAPWTVIPCAPGCSRTNPAVCTSFECIGFAPSSAVRFQYTAGVALTPPFGGSPAPEMAVAAISDLDADGNPASFAIQTNNVGNAMNLGQVADGVSLCPVGIEAGLIQDCTPLTY